MRRGLAIDVTRSDGATLFLSPQAIVAVLEALGTGGVEAQEVRSWLIDGDPAFIPSVSSEETKP